MKIISLKNKAYDDKSKDVVTNNRKASDTMTPISNKEWYNSIYTYNNNKTKALPILDNILIKLVRAYFNMLNTKEESKINLKYADIRKRKNIGNRTWVSKAELKHTNDKVIINLHVYNRKSNFLLKKLNLSVNKLYGEKIQKMELKKIDIKGKNNIFSFITEFYKNKITKLLSILKSKSNKLSFHIKLAEIKIIRYFFVKTHTNFLRRILKKELYIFYFKQNLLFNTLKYKNTYILPLKKLISKIYKKEIIFNIVNIKNYFINSDILTQIVSMKAKKRNNRIINVLKSAFRKVKTPIIRKGLIDREKRRLDNLRNFIIKKNIISNSPIDKLDTLLSSMYKDTSLSDINKGVLKSLKSKTITGVRLEASGRLTKRFTAQRSVFKLKYKGTLKNIDSAYKGLSSKMYRNQIGSNLQQTTLRSKNRIGAFGIKGWVNSV